MKTPSQKSDEVLEGIGKQEKRVSVMVNVTDGIRKLKKKRRAKDDEKVTDVFNDRINDAIDLGNRRSSAGR